MNDLLLAVLAIVILIVALAAPPLWRQSTGRRRMFERHSETFFKKAQALASDPETPPQVLSGLAMMNEIIMTRRGGRFLIWAFFSKPRPDDEAEKSAETEWRTVVQPFLERRPELGDAFAEMVTAFVRALLCNSTGISGWLARTALRNSISLLDTPQIARRVSKKSAKRNDRNGHGPNHHAPAAVA